MTHRGDARALVDGEAERRALAALVRTPAAAPRVPGEWLTEARHRAIYDALAEAGDVAAVFDRLPAHRPYLLDLLDPDADAILALEIRRLRVAHERRRLHAVLACGAHRLGQDDDADPREVVAWVRERLGEVGEAA
jgi:hypothetical protein